MITYKCDICKKEIKENAPRVSAGCGKSWTRDHLFCNTCGKPVISFLRKHGWTIKEESKSAFEKEWEKKTGRPLFKK